MGLSVSTLAGASALAVAELRRPETLREAVEVLFREAARWPCVLLGRGGFAILADHPGCVHVRIRAPLSWRVERFARSECLSRDDARRRVLREDRVRADYVKLLYDADIEDPSHFDLVCDASRFTAEALVDLLLVAARRAPHTLGGDPFADGGGPLLKAL